MYNEMPVFDYEDIQLIPNKCIIKSRSEADTHVRLGDYTFKLPVVPANMQTIIDEDIAEKLAKNGSFTLCIVLMRLLENLLSNACMTKT